MKNLKKLLVIAIVILGSAAASFAQSATATATANIVAAMTINHEADLNFGNIITDATGGTVKVTPGGTRTVETGSLTLAAGIVTAASFTLGGTGNAFYAITLPANGYIITHTDATHTMSIGLWTSTPSATGSLSNGAGTLNVGATLTVGNIIATPGGLYTNATPFEVTVNYN